MYIHWNALSCGTTCTIYTKENSLKCYLANTNAKKLTEALYLHNTSIKKKSLWYHLHNVHPMKPWVLPAQCKPTGTHNSITFTTHISIPIQHDITCTMQTQRNSMTRRKLWLYSHDDILPVQCTPRETQWHDESCGCIAMMTWYYLYNVDPEKLDDKTKVVAV